MNGNELLARIKSDSGVNKTLALGYVMGVSDTAMGYGHCMPTSVSAKQAVDVVQIALEMQPTDRHYAAESLVIRALATAWPCPKKGQPL